MSKLSIFTGLVVAASLGWAVNASASTLSTGLGAIGSPEPSWTITVDSSLNLSTPFTPTIVSGAANPPYPTGTWYDATSDSLASNWISPYVTDDNEAADPPHPDPADSDTFYTYYLEFADPNHDVTINWSSDNGAEFYLNGVLLSTIGDTAYSGLTTFVIPALAFLADNNFTVIVKNLGYEGSNPTGLLVDAAIPLPGALPLFVGALGGLGLLGRWRKRRSTPAIPA